MMPMIHALLFMLQVAATASPAPVPCSVTPLALPAPLAGWGELSSAPNIGKRFTVAGHERLKGLTAAEAARGGRAATLFITVANPGSYTLALGNAAWIDVASSGSTLVSTGHGHGPACSGIRKMVTFDLLPGRYAMRLSGMKTATIEMAILPN
ncbi:MAG: hypothetical protein B7Y49_06560 [Sphingomonas sp. 28-62-11]|nr:MAG: hypothetical protein B7Y49_06560 [Sphingomonas sp. 28-62-11]